MNENEEHFKIARSSEKSFGLTFGVVLLIFAGYLYIDQSSKTICLILLVFSFAFFITSFIRPRFFFLANILWFKLGILLGYVAAPLAMALIFYLVITPIGTILKAFGKDFVGKKIKNGDSYWINRSTPINSMKDQF